VRIALFGYGHMGRLHARHLADHDLVVVDPALGLEGSLAGIDAAVIATPTAAHAEVALPLLARGVPCLVEKPLAATLEEARALAASPICMVGHVERFNPAFGVLAGMDARFVQAERLSRWAARGIDVDVILDLMIHDLDLFCHLVPDDIVEVRANGLAVATDRFDLASARLETVGGRVGTFTASRLSRQAARRLRVFAAGGYWSLDLRERQAARVRWEEGNLVEERVAVPEQDALGAELAAFLAGARGDAPFPVPAADGLRALALALRIREAIR
jgi:predicted dehydrogenase